MVFAQTTGPGNAPGARAASSEDAPLKALFDSKRYSQVMDLGEKVLARQKKGDADWLYTKVMMTAAATKCQPLLNSTELARQAYEANPSNPVVIDNYAALQMLSGDKELAGKLFQKGIQLAADDFYSYVGLAQVYAQDPKYGTSAALAQLARAEAAVKVSGASALALSTSPSVSLNLNLSQKWLLIGDQYLIMNEPKLALAAYLKAEATLAGTNAADGQDAAGHAERSNLSGLIDQSIYRAALGCDRIDLALKKRDAALASPAVMPEVLVLTAARLCPQTPAGEALAKQVYEKALASAGGDNEFLYRLGRAFGNGGQDKYARLCLEKSLVNNSSEGKYVVAYAAQLAKAQDNVSARRQLADLAKRYKLDEPTPQRSLAHGLARAGMAMLKEYDSDWASTARAVVRGSAKPTYKTAYATLLKIKCHCRFLSMQYTMRAQPGVVFAFIPDDKTPVAFLIYDGRTTSPAQVWDKIKNEATVVPLAKSESMRDFPQLVQVALDYSEAPYRPLKPYYNFNPLPLRLLSR